jgi:FAD/FMN-containing dehydrogenase
MVPIGGQTGLVDGTVFDEPHVAISTERLRSLTEPDVLNARIRVGAGLTIGEVHASCPNGWTFAVDFGARESATVGGAIATNAGGLRVMRHGTMRRNVVGVEAVLADGSIVDDMRGLDKDNTGYDITQLMAGSEGTLAIITAAQLKLVPAPKNLCTALLSFASRDDAISALPPLQARLPDIEVAELMLREGLDLVSTHLRRTNPLPPDGNAGLLIEVPGFPETLAAASEELPGLIDAAVASSLSDRRNLFAWRESHTEAIKAQGSSIKLDLSLPRSMIGSTLDAVDRLVAAEEGATAITYGHLGDSSLHVSILGVPDESAPHLESLVLELVAAVGGSLSAEHGIGRKRASQLSLRRSQTEISIMKAVKAGLDEHGLLNPGVIFSI